MQKSVLEIPVSVDTEIKRQPPHLYMQANKQQQSANETQLQAL